MPKRSSSAHSPVRAQSPTFTRNRRGGAPNDLSVHTSWAQSRGFRYIYIFFLLGGWLFLRTFISADNGFCLTALLTIHNIGTFVFFHWIKGAPEAGNMLSDEHIYKETFWEQLEQGLLGTPTRRFLSVTPIALFFITIAFNVYHDDLFTLGLNTATTLLVLVPKMEALFGVRLFGINK
jgi:hypothetical protein